MRKRSFLIAIIFTVIVYSCESLNEPLKTEYSMSISAILEVNKDTQEVQIYRSLNYEDNIDYYDYGQYFVKGAEVKIVESENVFSDFGLYPKKESYHGYSFFYGNNSSLEILPGKKYELEVLAEGILMNGATTVPGDFEINIPGSIKNEEIAGMEVTWTKSDSAKFYMYKFQLAYQSPWDTSNYHNFDPVFLNTGYITYERKAIIGNVNYEQLEIDSVLICIKAFDKNIYKHLVKGEKNVGVTNAYGVFGSSVTKTAVIVIDKE